MRRDEAGTVRDAYSFWAARWAPRCWCHGYASPGTGPRVSAGRHRVTGRELTPAVSLLWNCVPGTGVVLADRCHPCKSNDKNKLRNI